MTDAFSDIKALNKTYQDMIEGCGCDHKKDKKKKAEVKEEKWPHIKDHKEPNKTPVKNYPGLGVAPTIEDPQKIKKIKESLNATCLFTQEELDDILDTLSLFEMRKQDKVAGVPKGGTDNMALRHVKKQLKAMHGGQQKKKVPGQKRTHRLASEGPTPKQKVDTKRVLKKRSQDMMSSRYD